jgi:hypothetical protein
MDCMESKNCGSWLACEAVSQAPKMLDVPASSRMNSFPHGLHGIQKLWELACLRSGEAGTEDVGCVGLFANELAMSALSIARG